jgi:hypothetical protein
VQSGGNIGECGLQVGVGDTTGHNPSRANSYCLRHEPK